MLFSSIKKYNLSTNNYFTSMDVIKHSNNSSIHKSNYQSHFNYILDLPSYIEKNYNLYLVKFVKNGKLHRLGGPAEIYYYENEKKT